ncbi:MAG: sigma-70 family RNA polymerase sigma factor [Myxococcaceae bacterium]|nr:MAG: sigma-70 family RNA polymerase sigma factor [Myxococcaceae bacterium]
MAHPPKKPGKPRPKTAARPTRAASRPGARARPGSAAQVSRRRGNRQERRAPEEVREVTPVEESDSSEAMESAEQTEPVDSAEPEGEELAELEPVVESAAATPAPSSSSSIARADPMAAYMAEVHRHPLLSREEEQRLARIYRSSGDLDAAARLVSANLRLVVKLAHEYHRNPLALLDLVQEGNIGLMQAVKKFDPDRGVKLSTYAAWWIRAYILRYIMDNWKLVKLGTTEAQRKLFFKLRQEQERLLKQGYEATPKLLAERLNVTEQDVVEMDQRLGPDEVSIDAPVGEDGDSTRGDRILPASSFPAADERLASEELKRLFHDKLETFGKTLEGRERYIFEKRLTADEPMTLQDIGTHFGISRERARQIEAALMDRMREFVRSEMPDFDLVAEPKP